MTLIKTTEISVHIRYKAQRTETLTLSLAKNSWQLRLTDPAIIAEIDRLLEDYTDSQVAEQLNAQQRRSGMGRTFHRAIVARLRHDYSLKSRYQRLRERGLLSVDEIAEQLNVSACTVNRWRRQRRLVGYAFSDKPQYLYEPPGDNPPVQ